LGFRGTVYSTRNPELQVLISAKIDPPSYTVLRTQLKEIPKTMPNVSGAPNGSAEHNLQQIHDDLIAIAKEAGEMMLAARPSAITSGSKKNCEFSVP